MQKHGERSGTMQARVLHRGGESSLAELRLALVTDAGGEVLFTVHFFTPVKDRVPATPPLQAPAPIPASAEASLPVPSSHTQTQALLLLSTDMHGRIAEWSEDATERFGYNADEIVRRGLHVLFRPSDATGFYSDLLALDTSVVGEATPVEWTFFHKTEGRQQGPFFIQKEEENGLSVSLLEEVTVISPVPSASAPDSGDAQDGTEAAASPVPETASEQPRTLAPVKPTPEDLSRERLLLGEAHHRVKNHLQIITSMLNLQMSTLHNDEARDALRSSQNRVRSIAALHQHLFQLATGDSADFKTFATGLIAHLRECYQVPEDRVSLQLDVPDRPVPEEWLMPLSLSLNEMVSNAFKHAYPDHRGGAMRVTLTWNDEEGELTVTDDGAGLPAGFTHHDSTGLGLKILRVFAGQIGGEVHIHSDPGEGAVFQLKFPGTSAGAEQKPDAEPAPESKGASENEAAIEA
jgi:two-component sensor histidine kinase